MAVSFPQTRQRLAFNPVFNIHLKNQPQAYTVTVAILLLHVSA